MNTKFTEIEPGLIRLMRSRHPLWWNASEASLSEWLAWFWNRGFLGASVDSYGHCSALVVVRLLASWQDFIEDWKYDPNGEICMVELALSYNRRALGEAVQDQMARMRQPQLVIWERQKKGQGSPRIYSWKSFKRMLVWLFGESAEAYNLVGAHTLNC
jgi:hypothetical protein